MCAHEKAEVDPLDKLIAIEWDIIHGLLKLLATGRSSKDKVRCANALAHHVNCLNKLLIQRGESPLDDENLAAMILKVFQYQLLRFFKGVILDLYKAWHLSWPIRFQ